MAQRCPLNKISYNSSQNMVRVSSKQLFGERKTKGVKSKKNKKLKEITTFNKIIHLKIECM